MKWFYKISDFFVNVYEAVAVLACLCIMLTEERTSFEWVLFIMISAVIMAVVKVRNKIAEKRLAEKGQHR